MTRKELAILTGYSETHISRIAGDIPGAKRKPNGRWSFDETHPKFAAWLERTATVNARRGQQSKFSVKRKRRVANPNMQADLMAIQNFVSAFDECRPFLDKLRFTSEGLQIDEDLSEDEWGRGLKIFKALYDLPPEDRLMVLFDYFAPLPPPPLLESFLKALNALHLPFFALSPGIAAIAARSGSSS